MKKVKHIILAIIIIFNCLILSGLLLVFVLIHKDNEKIKETMIADSVVHVDTCNNGTTVFLNDKGQLYGIGNNISGQLGVSIGETERYNRDEKFVTTPTLITDNVKYAVVGSDFIVILK